MGAPRRVSSIDDLDALALDDGVVWRPVGEALGIHGLAAGVWASDRAGGELIADHDETTAGAARHDEVYVVLGGRATFTLDGVEHDAPAGTIVHADVGVRRHAVAVEPGTRVLALGGVPHSVGAPSAWTRWTRAYVLRDAGDPRAGIAELEAALADHPDDPLVRYHLACLHAGAGDLAAAREHLAAAHAGDERTVAWARDNTELAALRDA